jgi:hypothetical protein
MTGFPVFLADTSCVLRFPVFANGIEWVVRGQIPTIMSKKNPRTIELQMF